ncbi:MAG: cadherin-like beta sandwich domain-containing protein [Ruminococcaceae bacterium]|nr:cadherin-like beta sandwich domain-containing protein [Oscillospiraceae bacterium]
MSKGKLLLRVSSVLMCLALLSADFFASAAILAFETQYDHEEADIAWLTDLVIKEDMTTVEGMAQRVELIPRPEYPYSETPESFKKDVDYYTSFYDLEEGSQRAGYIYFFELLNSNSEIVSGDVSDADIKEYLEGLGITVPSNAGSDELVMARFLYTAFASGSLGGSFIQGVPSLEEAAVLYLADLTGMNMESLKEWMPAGSVLSLDNYILAASRLTLWTNGYDVSSSTSEDEVYRLVAAMTVKAQGITVDSELSFNELKEKYLAVMLGKKYSVTMDSARLASAVDNGTAAYYVLQLIGKKGGLSIREDNASYEQAFKLVAENTAYFDLENDEFYADIYYYEAMLSTRNKSLWVYPTAYATDSDKGLVVSVNGTPIRNNYYNEVMLDPDKNECDLVITVTATGKNKTSKCTYTVHVIQGTYAGIDGDAPVVSPENENPSYATSDSLVSGILSSLGVNSVISSVLDNSYVSLPAGLSGIVSFIAPTFGDEEVTAPAASPDEKNDEFYISVLDDIGNLIDTEIEGIPGLGLIENLENGDDSYITFE